MGTTPIGRQALSELLLARIRQVPGMASVAEVSIGEIHDPDEPSNWRVTVLDSGTVDILAANHTASAVQDELRRKYVLAASR